LIPTPTESEINHGVPLFLDQVVEALRHQETPTPEIGRSAALHGHDLLNRGFTVGQVVHDYGDVCQSVTEIAVETNAPIVANGGRLYVRNLPGSGCVFIVDLPRHPPHSGEADSDAATTSRKARKDRRSQS
jgi:hypothetical protein